LFFRFSTISDSFVWAAMIGCICCCLNSSTSINRSSVIQWTFPSIIIFFCLFPTDVKSRIDETIRSFIGLVIKWPWISPFRTAPIGPLQICPNAFRLWMHHWSSKHELHASKSVEERVLIPWTSFRKHLEKREAGPIQLNQNSEV
jgi:hypothetical protein